MHAIHQADEHVDCTTALRPHPGEARVNTALGLPPSIAAVHGPRRRFGTYRPPAVAALQSGLPGLGRQGLATSLRAPFLRPPRG